VRFRRRPTEAGSTVEEQVEPLNAAETEWVAENVAAAKRMLDGTISAEGLDELWASLLEDESVEPNLAINLVGLAFGQLLADRLRLSWVALTDHNGTEIALRGPQDFTVFPTNFVGKRYPGRETAFIAPSYDEMVRTAESLG
jgi:hypothetical protein